MNRRKSARRRVSVELEIARPGGSRCRGYAENVSREGMCVTVREGDIPDVRRPVMVNLKIWTGTETLFRKLQARIVRVEDDRLALAFLENNLVTHAIVQDLLYYESLERRRQARLKKVGTNRRGSTRKPSLIW
jgi:hypothetical protein